MEDGTLIWKGIAPPNRLRRGAVWIIKCAEVVMPFIQFAFVTW